MAQTTEGTFRVPGGLKVENDYPVDDRYVVEFDSDLLSPTNLPNIYEGLPVYSLESKRHFVWNGVDRTDASNWIKIATGDGFSGNYADLSGKPNQYGRVNVSTNRILSNTDNNKTLIITGTVTLTFPSSIIEDFNFNFKVKAGGSLTIAGGSKTLLDTEENVVTSLTASGSEFGTCYQFNVDTFIVEGIIL